MDSQASLSAADAARQRLVEALVATGAEDRGAFRTLYHLTSAKLFGVCLRICGDRQAAEDVLSDVYLTIWKRAGAFEPGRASPISWLATIARNRAIDWRRSAGRAPPARIEEVADIADDRASAEDVMLLDERAGGAARLPRPARPAPARRHPHRFLRRADLCRTGGARCRAAGNDEELGPPRPPPAQGLPGR